jgi:hypothetical protein
MVGDLPNSSEDVLRNTLTGLFSIKGFLYYVSLHFELFSKIQIQNLKFLKHNAVDGQPRPLLWYHSHADLIWLDARWFI